MSHVLASSSLHAENVTTLSANISKTTGWILMQILPECLELVSLEYINVIAFCQLAGSSAVKACGSPNVF